MAKKQVYRDSKSDFNIDMSIADLDNVYNYIKAYPERVFLASKRASNRTANSIRSEARKLIIKDYTIKSKNIQGRIFSQGMKNGEAYAKVLFSSNLIELQNFKYNPTRIGIKKPKDGISVTIRKGERTLRQGSFLARAKNGIIKIYTRKTEKRLPIRREFGPSIASMIKKESIPVLKEHGLNRYIQTFTHEMRYGYKHKFKRKY